MDTQGGREQRRGDRYATLDTWVEFSEAGLLSLFKRASPTRAPIEDLGRYGFRMVVSEPIDAGKSLAVQITVPFMAEPLKLRATVAWCRSMPRSRDFHVGAEFRGHDIRFKRWMAQFEQKVGEVSLVDDVDGALVWMEEFEQKSGEFPVTGRCPHCEKLFRTRRWMLGKSVACPGCGKTVDSVEDVSADMGDAVRMAERVIEARGDMAGAKHGTIKASVLHPRVQHFLMKYIRTSADLVFIEYLHGREGTRVEFPAVARAVNCSQKQVQDLCEHFAALDIIKRIDQAFIYNPDMIAKRDVNDFMKDYGDPVTKVKVVAFIQSVEEGQEAP